MPKPPTGQVVRITRTQRGRSVAEVVRTLRQISWGEARRLVKDGLVRLDNAPCLDPTRRVQPGQRLELQWQVGGVGRPNDTKSQPTNKSRSPKVAGPMPVIRFIDEHIVVVDKPAGLTTMRHAHEAAEFGAKGKRFLPATLADVLPALLEQLGHKGKPIAVHRLDRDTSGLVAFARTPDAARHLGKQFREHTIERRYFALVRGQAKDGRIESHFIDDRGDGRRGSDPNGRSPRSQRAVTHVSVIEDLGKCTLVECRLETGRTHQVRIHLGERGTPLCGEHIYDRPLHGRPAPDGSGAPRLALHAAFLEIEHPATGKRMSWTAPLPQDLDSLLNRLRKRP